MSSDQLESQIARIDYLIRGIVAFSPSGAAPGQSAVSRLRGALLAVMPSPDVAERFLSGFLGRQLIELESRAH